VRAVFILPGHAIDGQRAAATVVVDQFGNGTRLAVLLERGVYEHLIHGVVPAPLRLGAGTPVRRRSVLAGRVRVSDGLVRVASRGIPGV
jgi:hypothetical protein